MLGTSGRVLTACVLLMIARMALSAESSPDQWLNDFVQQPVAKRPPLEVRYTSAARAEFEIVAADYRLLGQLRAPHCLRDAATGDTWLQLSVKDADGTVFRAGNAPQPSRINLYRRGPYFCEVHWFDLTVADDAGNVAPLKGDLALYCYPDQMLGSITWHATNDFHAASVQVEGIAPREFPTELFKKGDSRQFAFPIHGVSQPLAEDHLQTISAVESLHYDPVRGCYTIGSHNPSGFEGHFYEHPNGYETVRFQVTNDERPRTIYICHRTARGVTGSVEGGVILDQDDHPLPVTVQISKNFAGEKEEKFYNPTDQPFSETWFPLVLTPGEACTLSSLHLYQNWGRHMVKQFSSLGAWMDYFHSSTGVTETTCYVPFQFGGLPGVAVADFRAMSQTSFWGGQPQHDNVAGHSFLSYHDGDRWQYLSYQATTYHSTGPNWMDITLDYLSTDGKIRATVRTFELPQADELRNFIQVRYEVLQPLVIRQAKENLRLLTIASWVQKLRYTHFAAAGLADSPLVLGKDHFSVLGQPIARENSFLALYGESKGSNAILLQSWSAPFGPAGSVWCEKSGDTRLLLVPDVGDVTLEQGDTIEFQAAFMPYGEVHGADTCRREIVAYGSDAPRLVEVSQGEKQSDFPLVVRAEEDNADFVIQGGRDLIPVIVTGLSDYRWPSLYVETGEGRRFLSHARVGEKDGTQVFCADDGSYGAVFLVASNGSRQSLHCETGRPPVRMPRLQIAAPANEDEQGTPIASIRAAWLSEPVSLRCPTGLVGSGDPPPPTGVKWQESVGGSIWYEVGAEGCRIGVRLSPNEQDVDLECWVLNRGSGELSPQALFQPILAAASPPLQQTWILQEDAWHPLRDPSELSAATEPTRAMAFTSSDGHDIVAIAWPRAAVRTSSNDSASPRIGPDWPAFPPGRRVHARGKLYVMQGSLEDLRLRIERELPQ